MAANLLKARYSVRAWGRTPARAAQRATGVFRPVEVVTWPWK
jgi:hypothetical protein